MIDTGHLDEKIICIPFDDPSYNIYTEIAQLPKHIFDEMRHFFSIYKELEHKETVVNEVSGLNDAVEIIEKSIASYKKKYAQN